MKASELFTSEEIVEVKEFVDFFNGTLTRVVDESGKVLFESKYSFENFKYNH